MDAKTISVTDLIKKLTRPVDSVQTVTGSWEWHYGEDKTRWEASGPSKFNVYSDSEKPKEIEFGVGGTISESSDTFHVPISGSFEKASVTTTVDGKLKFEMRKWADYKWSDDEVVTYQTNIESEGVRALCIFRNKSDPLKVSLYVQKNSKWTVYNYDGDELTTEEPTYDTEDGDIMFTQVGVDYMQYIYITEQGQNGAIVSVQNLNGASIVDPIEVRGDLMDMYVGEDGVMTYVSVVKCDEYDGTCVRKLIVFKSGSTSNTEISELHENQITPGDHYTDTITSVKMGPDGAWPFMIHAGDSIYEWWQDGKVVRKLTGVQDILGWGSNGSGRAIIYRLKSSPEKIQFEPSLVPNITSTLSELSDNGTFLRTYSGNSKHTITVAHQSQEDVLGITKWARVSSSSDNRDTVTFSPNRQYVLMEDSAGRLAVRRFVLYSKRLFDGLTSDSDIERYLEYFQMICESEYGKGDPFCRCANYGGGLTEEYGLDDDTYLSKRLRQSVQCLDGDCIYRKNLKNNIVSVYKLNATDCNMDLTVCSSDFNSKDISASSQVNVVNQCGVGTDQATPDFNNNSSSVSGLRAPSIITCVAVSLLLLFLVGAYIHYRSGRGKGKK
jgi:hypothetical protein